jgi:hypothetical protein
MNLQFIHDTKGNTTGVFIPIEEWQLLKEKYTELQDEEATEVLELSILQTQILDQRLNDYYSNRTAVENFDDMIDDIEKR